MLRKYFFPYGVTTINYARSLDTMNFLIKSGADVNETAYCESPGIYELVSHIDEHNDNYLKMVNSLLDRKDIRLDYKLNGECRDQSLFGILFIRYELVYRNDKGYASKIFDLIKRTLTHPNVNLEITDSDGKKPKVAACDRVEKIPFFEPVCKLFP